MVVMEILCKFIRIKIFSKITGKIYNIANRPPTFVLFENKSKGVVPDQVKLVQIYFKRRTRRTRAAKTMS